MKDKSQKLVDYFKKEGALRFSRIFKAGFHPDTLSLLQRRGIVEKVGRGLYKLRMEVLSSPDLVMATQMVTKGVICLISALSFHGVTDEIPRFVSLAIPEGTRANKVDYPPVKCYRFSREAWKSGVENHKVDGYTVRIYSLAKSIADCFKFRNSIGVDVARNALKSALKEQRVSPREILYYARVCRVHNIIKPILETLQ